MMISTKGRYALRVMTELALCSQQGYVSLKDIAQRQEISEKYLEAIMKSLVKENIVVGIRGKNGGYRLAQPAEQCTVGSVLRATEGSLAPVACLEMDVSQCPRKGRCATLPMWQELGELIDDFFDNITIAKLAKQATEIEDGTKII